MYETYREFLGLFWRIAAVLQRMQRWCSACSGGAAHAAVLQRMQRLFFCSVLLSVCLPLLYFVGLFRDVLGLFLTYSRAFLTYSFILNALSRCCRALLAYSRALLTHYSGGVGCRQRGLSPHTLVA